MAKRVQKEKVVTKNKEKVEEVPKTDSKEELKDELDELLDEIDSVLEENAQDFVNSYIQKGGQLCETLWYNVKSRNQRVVLRLRGLHEGLQGIRL